MVDGQPETTSFNGPRCWLPQGRAQACSFEKVLHTGVEAGSIKISRKNEWSCHLCQDHASGVFKFEAVEIVEVWLCGMDACEIDRLACDLDCRSDEPLVEYLAKGHQLWGFNWEL